MMERKNAAIAGISTIIMAGATYVAWQKSRKHRKKYLERFGDWRKDQIADVYFKSLDERDIAWG